MKLPRDTGRAGSAANPQPSRIDLGTLTLSPADVAGLDKLIDYYHSSLHGVCTTHESVTLTQQRNGKTVATEQIIDDTCGAFRRPDRVSFSALVHRLSAPSQKH